MKTKMKITGLLLVSILGCLIMISMLPNISSPRVSITKNQPETPEENPPIPSNGGASVNETPGNLTGVIIDTGVLIDKGLNESIGAFVTEWEYQFGKTLPIHVLNASDVLGGLSNVSVAIEVLNGSLIWWNASKLLENQSINVLPTITRTKGSQHIILTPWKNNTLGSGWIMDAGCEDTMQRFTAYHSITMSRFSRWEALNQTMRFQIQFGGISWLSDLPSIDTYFKAAVSRQINYVEIGKAPLNEIANLSLDDYDYVWSAQEVEEREVHLEWLNNILQLAAKYHVKIFLATDELIMTEPMYQWLNTKLGYSGPAYGAEETKFFPDEIKDRATAPDSPVWELIQAKYNATVDAIHSTWNPTNRDGFGGFKFRIDDISLKDYKNEEVYKKVSFMHTVETLGRFINITTAEAAVIGAEVVQRTWMLQETENPFNNATLCKQMLDPIQATNLILRTKETWNDHWLNHPANPTMGVSHHRWIIGWFVTGLAPYYRGFLHDWYAENGTKHDLNGTLVGWWENPNIVGYDQIQILGDKWRTLASPIATEDASVFYLIQHTLNGTRRAGEALKEYFWKVGMNDTTIIENLTRIFDLSTEAFRQLFFMKAWSSSGKFRGDVVNGGMDLKYDPVRFNMFYQTFPGYGDLPGVQYTIQEGYNGSLTAKKMAESCPNGYPGFGSLNSSPNYIDPATVSDYSNLTQVLGYFRGHIKAYAAFADMFAEWRAWHVAYYHWAYTWNANSFAIAEQARVNVVIKHMFFQENFTPQGWGFIYTYNQLEGPWMAIVGHTGQARAYLFGVIIISVIVLIAFTFAYEWKGITVIDGVKIIFGSSSWKKRDVPNPFIDISSKKQDRAKIIKWFLGTTGIPVAMSIGWFFLFEGVFAWRLPYLAFPFLMIIIGLGVGARVGVFISQLIGKKDTRSLHAIGFAIFWQWALLLVLGIILLAGGSFNVLLVINSPGIYVLAILLLSFVMFGSISFLRNIKYEGKKHAIGSFFIILGCMVGVVLLISLIGGGPVQVFDDFMYQLDNLF